MASVRLDLDNGVVRGRSESSWVDLDVGGQGAPQLFILHAETQRACSGGLALPLDSGRRSRCWCRSASSDSVGKSLAGLLVGIPPMPPSGIEMLECVDGYVGPRASGPWSADNA